MLEKGDNRIKERFNIISDSEMKSETKLDYSIVWDIARSMRPGIDTGSRLTAHFSDDIYGWLQIPDAFDKTSLFRL